MHETLTCLLPEERHGLAADCGGGWVRCCLEEAEGAFVARVEAQRDGLRREDMCRLPQEGQGPLGAEAGGHPGGENSRLPGGGGLFACAAGVGRHERGQARQAGAPGVSPGH